MMGIMSWEKLAETVRARRAELGLTQEQVAQAGAISVEWLRNIETQRRSPARLNPRKARGLELALEWESGSIDAVLAGGVAIAAEPKPDVDATPDLAAGDRFGLARQVLSLRATLSAHRSAMTDEARHALLAEVERSAREAETAIVAVMPWLNEAERGDAIALLTELREPLDPNE
jgi:transcriptional regulator with XRE-family HTH domain